MICFRKSIVQYICCEMQIIVRMHNYLRIMKEFTSIYLDNLLEIV